MNRIRLTVVATHPVQYQGPWFRYIAEQCPELDLTVLYGARPTPAQQGVGFNRNVEWDRPLEEGYRARVVRETPADAGFDSENFRGLDVKEIGAAVLETRPDVVLIPGWHSVTLVRALLACARRGIPVLYRGDSNLASSPAGSRSILRGPRTRVLLGRFSAYLAVGSRAREYLLHHGAPPTRIYSSPHTVDNAFFASQAAVHLTVEGRDAARAALGAARDDFIVLFAGKLVAKKRPLDLMRAIGRQPEHTMLAVAGSGDLEHDMRAESERLGVRVGRWGFANQGELPQLYAAADCLALPSGEAESWGLVVNEGLATGLPAVVSDAVGCADDLITAGETGEVFHAGDVADLAAALARVREQGGRRTMAEACQRRVEGFGFEQATTGLLAACQDVVPSPAAPRVVLCGTGMVMVGGLERMTFEVLRVVRQHGGSVHCIVNSWENHRIVPLANRIGASWSTGFHRYAFRRRAESLVQMMRVGWDVARTSLGLLGDAVRFRATHVLVPEHSAVLRNLPALALLRVSGVKIIFRMGNAPERGRFYDVLWRVVSPFVTRFVPNSNFSHRRLQETGVANEKITLIRNAPSRRVLVRATDEDVVALAAKRRTILTVGQIAPFKGTHLAVEAVLRLIAAGHDVQAVIVGTIPTWPDDLVAYARELQQLVKQAGMEDRIHFVGIRENVPEIMKASYVLAAPILQEETFGNVLLEARHVGLPVVTFDRGGLVELVAHRETGFVCRSADLDGLVEGLDYFLSQPDERLRASRNSLAANVKLGEDCTPAEFERRWWALFERAS